MLLTIRKILEKIINDIDAGNSNMTEQEAIEVLQVLKSYTDSTRMFNRTQAAKYLHCSVQTFDNYRKQGKLPSGHKEAGGVIQWTKRQLDDFIERHSC